MRFTGKVAVITAFANGIGRATADIMAREGAVVVGVDNDRGRLDEAVAALPSMRDRPRRRSPPSSRNLAGSTSWSMPSAAVRSSRIPEPGSTS
jgi:NAD(P)-dependent dehydrogenase (short-subunit alcohol dehydrogenase family)